MLVSAFLITGLAFGTSYMRTASATVPGINQLANKDVSSTYGNAGTNNSVGNGRPYLSGDGRYVAFSSAASNLVAGDTNGKSDVFVKDTSTGAVTMAGGGYSNDSFARGISYDGRYVLFQTGTTGNTSIRDLVNLTTTTVCTSICNATLSGDGRYVLYAYKLGSAKSQVYITNVQTGATKLLSANTSGSPANADSYIGGISCDGGIMSFYSTASDMPSGAGGYLASIDVNGTLSLTKISAISQDSQVSCNGNIILSGDYSSAGYVKTYDRLTAQTTTIATYGGVFFSLNSAALSDDGRFIALSSSRSLDPAYPSTNAGSYWDVYVYDTRNSTTQLVTYTVAGNRSGEVSTSVSISADGTTVAYGYLTPTSTDTTHELISGVNTGTASTQLDIYTSKTGF
jgi:hypothetical protein